VHLLVIVQNNKRWTIHMLKNISNILIRFVITAWRILKLTFLRFMVNDQLDSQFFLRIYFNSLHVSSNIVFIIRRINCINTTSSICHYVSVNVSCSGRKVPTWTRNGHRHIVKYTRCCIGTIDSPDDEHWVARNMQRIEINT